MIRISHRVGPRTHVTVGPGTYLVFGLLLLGLAVMLGAYLLVIVGLCFVAGVVRDWLKARSAR